MSNFPVLRQVPKRTGTFISFDGTPIYYEVRGDGPPIVLCYGIACVINHWTHQIRAFSHVYQTIVFDYRGHHHTPEPEDRDNLTIDAIARDLKGLLDHLGIEKASLWGHSWGAMILLRFFDLYPRSVANLVFINGFARNPISDMFGVDAVDTIFKLLRKSYRAFPTTLSSLWKAAVSNPFAIFLSSVAGGFNLHLTSMKDIEVYARGVAAMDLEVFLTLFDQMIKYDATPVLDRIDIPTLIISGNKDGVTPRSYQELMHKKIHGSQFLAVPYGSHCTQLDLPDFVNLRIEKFLQEHRYVRPAPKKDS
jgi:pimeloyl-ACP methyl ester carboxylesterase